MQVFIKVFNQRMVVDQVAVMHHANPKGETGHQWLQITLAVTANRRIAGMAHGHIAHQRLNVVLLKNLRYQAQIFFLIEFLPVRVEAQYARSILTAVLQS